MVTAAAKSTRVADVISGEHGIDWAAPPGSANRITDATARDLGNHSGSVIANLSRQSLLPL
jgi:hypothetical protein